ncbi:MAG: type III pantothenate kinase [Candidatus Neomarinimicrobiota bacterium]|nr:MAG: type III pantothenate kinase [Candidatus Neomarinimicrobiota bacterium]
MLLAIDVGNTNTVLGIFEGENLVECWRIASSHTRTVDESWMIIKLLCQDAGISKEQITGIIISSVVPQLTHIFELTARKYFKINPIIVNCHLNLGLKILYKNPEEVGADRICNAVAGKNYYSLPLIIVDFGTATTFDILSADGDYLGGVISPGLETAANDLVRRAAKLYKIKYEFPKSAIGKTTVEAMQYGILYGHVFMVDNIIDRIAGELKHENVEVIATGGIAEEISKHSARINKVDPQLTLKGLMLIYKMNT